MPIQITDAQKSALNALAKRNAQKRCDKVPDAQKKDNYYCRRVNEL